MMTITPAEIIPPNMLCVEHVEKKLLQVFLLSMVRSLLHEQFCHMIQFDCADDPCATELYGMDHKIIQLVIRGIVESGEYTLEGIAYQTRIPFDIIWDAARGNGMQLSMTAWGRIVDLYMQIKPNIYKLLLQKLLQLESEDPVAISALLHAG